MDDIATKDAQEKNPEVPGRPDAPSVKPSPDKVSWRWLAGFLGLSAAFYFIEAAPWFQKAVLMPFGAFLAKLTGYWLLLLGLPAQWSANTLELRGATFTFSPECTGVLVFMIFAAAVIPFPTTLKSRGKGLALGAATVFALNLLRSLLIVLIGSRWREAVWSMHVVVGQILTVSGTFLVFLLWARGTAPGALPKPPRRTLLLRAGWFAVGWLIGHTVYYGLFLTSALGEWLRSVIVAHGAWLLSFFLPASSRGNALTASGASMSLTPGCMASPVIVVLTAVVFAWPGRWRVKLPLLAAGFLPACYLYNLARLCAIALSAQPRTDGHRPYLHSHFGLILLVMATVVVLIWRWVAIRPDLPLRRRLGAAGAGLVLATATAFAVDALVRGIVLPFLLRTFSAHAVLQVDPDLTVTRMAGFMAFFWVLLSAVTPAASLRRGVIRAAWGLLALAGLYLGFALGLQVTNLALSARVVKAATFLLPLGLYLVLLRGAPLRRGKMPAPPARDGEEAESPGNARP